MVTEGDERAEQKPEGLVAIYTRVCSHEHRANLERQAQRLEDSCAAKGYRVEKVVKEIGSGVNEKRAKGPSAPGRSAHEDHCGGAQRSGHTLWRTLCGSAATQPGTNARSGESRRQ